MDERDDVELKRKTGYAGLRPNTEARACFFSKVTYIFMIPLFWLGFRRKLQITDLSEPLDAHMSKVAVERMERAWIQERRRAAQKGERASLFGAIVREYWWNVMKFGVFLFLEEFVKLLQPYFMGHLIRYFEANTNLSENDAYFAAGGVAFTCIFYVVVHHPYFFGLQKIGLELKVGASGLLMKKGVSLSSSALHRVSVGRLINLITTDVNKFDSGFLFFHFCWVSPLLLIGYGYMLWSELGASCLAGFGALLLLCPFQIYLSRRMGACRREIATRTDKRISVMNEILNGIRVLKMYAWEEAFSEIMSDVRRDEIKKVRLNAIYQSMVMGLFWVSGKLMILFAIVCFLLVGNGITAERVFVATALYNACRLPVTLFFPFSLQFLFELRVSIKRIQEFLELEDYESVHSSLEDSEQPSTSGSSKRLTLDRYTALWCEKDEEAEVSDTKHACVDVSLDVVPNNLIAIIGTVGSGKSSLLSAILGEARRVSGHLKLSGSVAYVPQDPWIFSGTVRDNILFGMTYEEKRYKDTVAVCELNADFEQFDRGDASLVGDRGTALSGGQKARICLARAVYRNADVYLLDDPLSAVDTSVGRKLFENCIYKHLREKIVLLVTHQVQYLDKADKILILDGSNIIASGTMAELRLSHSDVFKHLDEHKNEDAESEERKHSVSIHGRRSHGASRSMSAEPQDDESQSLLSGKRHSSSKKSLVLSIQEEIAAEALRVKSEDEDSAVGAVSWSVYWTYIKSMCTNPFFMPPLILFFLGVQVFSNFIDWWINKWTTAAESYTASNGTSTAPLTIMDGLYTYDITIKEYRMVFIVSCVLLTLMSVSRCIWFRVAQTVASCVLHDKMFKAVVHAKMFFFDSNPIGRILNRFSKDVGTLDDQLSFVFFDFFMGLINIIGMFVVIIMVNFYVIVAAIPIILIFMFLRTVYLSTSREVKRIESTSRSPLYSHISAVMHGLVTVRAFNNQEKVLEDYHRHQNINVAAFYATLTTSRWFAAGIDWLAAAFVTCVAFFLIAFSNGTLKGGEVGLTMVYAVQLTGFFSWIMRQSAELQNGMVSVERIVEYSELESEPRNQPKPNLGWPSEGRISMKSVSLKYEGTTELVLDNIDLEIKAREKIGIVGRTGAGKSSLLRALFRLTEPMGSISVDGIDISEIDLLVLRKKISIIPQDPVLFIGTLRRNLDPFDEFDDDQLWDALEQVEMKATVAELSRSLETHMQEGGVNFSVGQRQLICLARALLRSSKILVIDEATANVDLQTDALIQDTIRKRFASSTVLTIAHRLKTIMDSDRVMVLEHGKLVECDHPHVLLKNSESYFSSLVAETGPAASQLKEIARVAYAATSTSSD
ncbi:hypothetical protein L596_015893 [Steinernema carpocapsae]|uniref:Cystic fibrosis transmembrane conductance regulator n=1 Tax=Steinernema carpocapsae TaxID=34508 RepID=A0A4U5NHA8_STECR|nr:hypothetical protein L596_015893 [Steinernema carpocapsae]